MNMTNKGMGEQLGTDVVGKTKFETSLTVRYELVETGISADIVLPISSINKGSDHEILHNESTLLQLMVLSGDSPQLTERFRISTSRIEGILSAAGGHKPSRDRFSGFCNNESGLITQAALLRGGIPINLLTNIENIGLINDIVRDEINKRKSRLEELREMVKQISGGSLAKGYWHFDRCMRTLAGKSVDLDVVILDPVEELMQNVYSQDRRKMRQLETSTTGKSVLLWKSEGYDLGEPLSRYPHLEIFQLDDRVFSGKSNLETVMVTVTADGDLVFFQVPDIDHEGRYILELGDTGGMDENAKIFALSKSVAYAVINYANYEKVEAVVDMSFTEWVVEQLDEYDKRVMKEGFSIDEEDRSIKLLMRTMIEIQKAFSANSSDAVTCLARVGIFSEQESQSIESFILDKEDVNFASLLKFLLESRFPGEGKYENLIESFLTGTDSVYPAVLAKMSGDKEIIKRFVEKYEL